jgi:hypothetical protein
MDTIELLNQLLAADIIHETIDGGFQIDEHFDHSVEKYAEQLRGAENSRSWLRKNCDSENIAGILAEKAGDTPDIVATYLALQDHTADVQSDVIDQLSMVLSQLRVDDVRTDGAPDPFLPIEGDKLGLFLDFQSLAVIYCWREECEPCDLMRKTLETAFVDPPENILLLSVYGPRYARYLQNEYSVKGAPTTLFVANGQVDSRLHGAHYEETVTDEIKKLSGPSK